MKKPNRKGCTDEAEVVDCECGHAMGEPCQWSGPKGETLVVEWMPEQYRESHRAAGNSGQYPHNGALRLRVHLDCAAGLAQDE